MMTLPDYASQLYQQPGIQECCLELQDNYRLDIPYTLFMCWYGRYYGMIDAALAEKSLRLSQTISDAVVKPLRQARRWMKQDWPLTPLREQIKTAELAAELALLGELESACQSGCARPDAEQA